MKAYYAVLTFYQEHKIAVRIAGAGVVGLLVVVIVSKSIISAKAKDRYPELNDKVIENYVDEKTYEKENDIISVSADESPGDDISWNSYIDVDFGELSKINPEIKGWIFFEDENISYPLLYSGDNEKYLDIGYDGEPLDRGSIFIDGRNNPDLEDTHTIIYGHNMRDGQMFGRLKQYERDPEYYSEHRYFQILVPDAKYRYEIIGYEQAPEDSDRYRVEFSSQTDADRFMEELDAVNMDKIQLGRGDKIITLSTCTSDDDTRFLVHAVRIDFSR